MSKPASVAAVGDPIATRDAEAWAAAYEAVRRATDRLVAPLGPEDMCLQSMPDTSPPKWHLAHTSWFFETFVLASALPDLTPFDPRFSYLFNSYYQSVGPMHARPNRGLLTRPAIERVREYRSHVDARVLAALRAGALDDEHLARLALGLAHEEQHQELLLTDLKHGLWCNPLRPAYREAAAPHVRETEVPALRFFDHPGGVREIGAPASGFAFDHERPRHRVLVPRFAIASRLVTCGDYLEFIADGGYRRPKLWLSAGWDHVRTHGWQAPLYWHEDDGAWSIYTLFGMRPLDRSEPVCHVSLFEADAFARWRGDRLPTELEWEIACQDAAGQGTFLEDDTLHPRAWSGERGSSGAASAAIAQAFGDVWEWTASAYAPYPGFRPLGGALGEYNGKFMCNQLVLRGGSCVTPRGHVRPSYRNFFPPEARWQFSGIRLAADR